MIINSNPPPPQHISVYETSSYTGLKLAKITVNTVEITSVDLDGKTYYKSKKEIFDNRYKIDENKELSDKQHNNHIEKITNYHLEFNIAIKNKLKQMVEDSKEITDKLRQDLNGLISTDAMRDKIRLFAFPRNQYYVEHDWYGSFPSTHAPNIVNGGTWRLIYNSESVGFRTEGSYANNRRESGGIQQNQARRITGSFISGDDGQTHSTGAFKGIEKNGIHRITNGYLPLWTVGIDNNILSGITSSESVMKNRKVRIWIKV